MNAGPAGRPRLPGGVYRIHWVLGSDRLLAVCHCSAEREFDGPVELWDWLHAHPVGHDPVGSATPWREGPTP